MTDESRIEKIAKIYGVGTSRIERASAKFPRFVWYDHELALGGVIGVYGVSCPSLSEHPCVLGGIMGIYGLSKEEAAKTVLKFLPFAGYDHKRVLDDITETYDVSREKAAKTVLKFLPFAGYNHKRVLDDITETYGISREEAAKAVIRFPQFAGLNHKRVLKQKTRIGRLVGLTRQETVDLLIEAPSLAGYSAKRDLARIDIARYIKSQGAEITDEARDWFISNYFYSPYVKGTNRLRISQADRDYAKPELQAAAERKFLK